MLDSAVLGSQQSVQLLHLLNRMHARFRCAWQTTVYYFNAASGVSQWEQPLWLDEIDPVTGAVYYVNSERYLLTIIYIICDNIL